MASSSSGTSYIPPLPQRPKITSAGDHWLHSSFATGDINPADLAPKVAVWASGTPTPDPQHSERLTQFFSRIATFNKTAFSQLDSLDANKAFTLLGHGSLTNIGITNVKSEPRTFAVCAFAAVKLADMLAWAADPSNAASPAVASPLPDQMSGGDGLLRRDWVEGMKHAYATFEASPGVFKPPGPAKKDNINFRASDHPVLKVLGCSTRKRFSQFTNLHTFVYMIQVFLDYGPYLDKKTIRTIIADEAARAKAHYSDDQMKILVKTFEAVKLCQPLLYAFSHFPAALLTSFPSISQRSTEALTSSLARGTAHFVDPESSLSKINRLFLRLALNAALSKGSTTDAIPGTFFEDPDFDKALQIPVDDTQTRGVLRFPHAIEVKPDPPHPSVAQGASIAGMSASVTAQPNGASLDTLPDSDSPGRSAIQDNPTALPRSPSPGRSADATGASSPTELTGDADNDHIPVDESMQSDSAKADASHPISADVPHPDPSGNAPIESNLSAPQPSPPPGPSADATGASSPTEITRDAGSDHVPVDENMQVDSAEADASLPISADMPHSDPPGDAPIESSLSAPQPSPPSGPSADASGASPPQALAGSDNPPRPVSREPTPTASPQPARSDMRPPDNEGEPRLADISDSCLPPTDLGREQVCTRSLRKRKDPPLASHSPSNLPSLKTQSPRKGKRKASASIPRDGRKRHHSDRKQALSADERTVAWASHEGIPQHVREPQVLLHEFQDSANHLDPTLTYPLASGKRNEVTIEYYIFRHDVRDEGQLLVASKHAQPYKWVPFKGHEKQARTFRKMIASQPMGTLDNGMNVPLHVHPSAQLFHSSGLTHDAHGQPLKSDIVPGPNQSMFYVAPEERFNSLTGVQRDHLLGQRGILLVHAQPQCRLRAGVEAGFNLQTFMEFTDPTRLAHVHDLGACKPAEVPPNKAARPIDLLISARLREEGSCSRQRLNLLSNPLGHKSMPLPAGWPDIALHEDALQFLETNPHLPSLESLWKHRQWAIFSHEGAATFLHEDILFTTVNMISGAKLWFAGRKRPDRADDLKGNMFSRRAFDKFNGWLDNTGVWEFECLHLDQFTTLYMPASTMHAVISLNDCVAAGRHGIPASNVTQCVLTTLHNVMLSNVVTNVDHEPARRLLLRIFELYALSIVSPFGEGDVDSALAHPALQAFLQAEQGHHSTGAAPLARVDVTSANGLVDLLALRSFVVLYLPLCSWLYPHMTKDGIMLVPSELLQEIEYAWSLTAKLDTFLSAQYRLQAITEGEIAVPDNFVEAADDCLCTMAASLLRYQVECHKIPEVRKEWPEGFDEPTFQELLLQAVARFYLHREQVNSPKSSPNAHGSNTEVERASVPLYQRLQALIEEEDDALFLLKWNPRTIPFILQPIQPPLSL